MKKSTTKSPMSMDRSPPGPVATTVAPVASSTEFQSPSGSQCATEPQTVPRLRTSGSEIHGAAEATAPPGRSEATMSAWRAVAPMRRCPLVRSRTSRPGISLMSTSSDGAANRSFSIGIRLWPPARMRASSPPSASASTASATERATVKSNDGGYMATPYRARCGGPLYPALPLAVGRL